MPKEEEKVTYGLKNIFDEALHEASKGKPLTKILEKLFLLKETKL